MHFRTPMLHSERYLVSYKMFCGPLIIASMIADSCINCQTNASYDLIAAGLHCLSVVWLPCIVILQ